MPPRTPAQLREALVYQTQRARRKLDTVGLELLYQNNYLELARRTPWLDEPPLGSPGGGTASFSQLYALLAVLRSDRCTNILELGVGQSTKLITSYVTQSESCSSVHVDDDEEWLKDSVPEGGRITRLHAPLVPTVVGDRSIRWYDTPQPSGTFDLILVDGPMGWSADVRYDRLGILNWLPECLSNQFVVIVDDSSRPGEHELAIEAHRKLNEAGRPCHVREIIGANSQTLIATEEFRFALFL